MDKHEQQLYDRLDKNLQEYHEHLQGFEKSEIIDMAGRISAMSDTYFYLTEHHDFEPDEVTYLLNFQHPLEVVADKWMERQQDISDMSFVLSEVFDKKDALGDYPLAETANQEHHDASDGKKPSIRQRLRDAAKEVKPRPEPGTEKPDKGKEGR